MTQVLSLRLPRAGRPLLDAARAGLAISPVTLHAARAVIAALLALWVAFQLELPTPYSAATTVLIVAHPVHGMVLSKSLYRLAGTLLGAGVAVILLGSLGQQPELFILALSLWMGVCTATSTILRNFRSYGAVLAGYTVVLICLPIVEAPETVFTAAVGRVSVVTVGIACSALVASLTTRRSARRTLELRLAAVLAELAGYVQMAVSGGDPPAMTRCRRKLAVDISSLDALAEYAAVEAGEAAGVTESLRGAIMAMFGAMTIATSTHAALARMGGIGRPDRLLEDVGAVAARLAATVAAGSAPGDMEGIRAVLAHLGAQIEGELDARDRSRLAVLDRLGELLDELALCLDAVAALAGRRLTPSTAPWRAHLDLGWAAMNGLRATVAVWLAGALWIVTAWPAGSTMVAMIVPNVGLLSLRSRPATDALDFVWGTLLASALGFAYLVWLLPAIDGFPMLALSLAPVLLAAVILSMTQRTAFIGVGVYVFFITLLAPANPMTYDPEGFLSNALATVGGAVLTTVVYRLVLPADPRRHVRALVRAIQADVEALPKAAGDLIRTSWETRMHDRLTRLGSQMRAAGVAQDGLLRGGFAALRIGREILRLHKMTLSPPAAAAVADALGHLQDMARAPHRAVLASDEAAGQLLALADQAPGPMAVEPLRAAASLTEIAILLGRHRRFFQRNPRK